MITQQKYAKNIGNMKTKQKKNEFKRYVLTGLSSKGFILLQQNYKIILVKVMKSFDVKNNCS